MMTMERKITRSALTEQRMRDAATILEKKGALLTWAEREALEAVAAGHAPGRRDVTAVTEGGAETVTSDCVFERLCTEFAGVL